MGRCNSRRAKAYVVLVDLDLIRNPDLRRVMKKWSEPIEIEIAGTVNWEIHVAHGLERHAHHQVELPSLRLHEREHSDSARNVVRERRRHRQADDERRRYSDGNTWTDQTLAT